jgi:hypothetical membrane protein
MLASLRTMTPRETRTGLTVLGCLVSVALLGIGVYVALDVVLGFLPPHYSVLHQPESDYGVGPYGYLMGINFIVRGVLSLALVVVLWAVFPARAMRTGAALLGLWAVASMLLTVFPTDVEGAAVTAHGRLHVLVALVAFLAVLIGELVLSHSGRGDTRWQRVIAAPRAVAWLALPALLWLVGALGQHTAEKGTAGLAERLFLGLVMAWMGLVAYRLRPVLAERGDRRQGASASA